MEPPNSIFIFQGLTTTLERSTGGSRTFSGAEGAAAGSALALAGRAAAAVAAGLGAGLGAAGAAGFFTGTSFLGGMMSDSQRTVCRWRHPSLFK